MVNLAILGSTGSIGGSTLDVVRRNKERFRVYSLAAGRNLPVLLSQIEEFLPKVVVVADDLLKDQLATLLADSELPPERWPELLAGASGRVEAACAGTVDVVISAIVGVAGLEATYEAIRAHKRIGLANKEVLVSGGELVMDAVREHEVELIPVDSEHNGAHQCLRAGSRKDVTRLILTASGGPFRNTPIEALASVTPKQALRHPTWKMGNRITIDSATLMNKGFEVIEACWLFDLKPSEVEVVVHPQSSVHAMVEYNDGSVIAQISATDMRMPIQYALTYPERSEAPVPTLDWRQARTWEFHPPDFAKFPLLGLAYAAIETGGSATCTLNAADEIAVEAFLEGRIGFQAIAEVVEETLNQVPVRRPGSIDDILEIDRESRSLCRELVAARLNAGKERGAHSGLNSMVVVQNIVWLLVLIGVMILIHELGHFWAARYYNVSVEVFSIGFGPRLFGFRRGETDYRFSAILFGGYVKFRGDQPGEEGAEHPDGLLAKPRWQRLIVAFAGPFMNIILAIGLLTGLFMVKFQKLAEPEQRAVIGHVIKDSAAAKAGLLEGDRIVGLDGEKDPTWDDIAMKEFASAYRPMRITVERGGKRFDTDVTPVLDDKMGVGFAGWSEKGQTEVGHVSAGMPAEKAGLKQGDVLLSANGQSINSTFKLQEVIEAAGGKPIELRVARDSKEQTFNVQPTYSNIDGHSRWMIGVGLDQKLNIITTKLSLPDAFTEAMHQNVKGASLIYQFLKGVLERRMSPKQLNGPIGIAQLSGDAAREGPSAFIHLMSMVSLNLAIFNLLPIPILDGGVIVLLLVEILIGRDLSMPVKEAVIKVGFVFLMVVTVFALYNDISKILPAG